PLRALKFLNEAEFYANYLAQARVFVTWFRQSLNARWSALNTIYPLRSSGREAVAQAGEILEIWQGLTRDLIMLNLGAPDLIQHAVLQPELAATLAALAQTLTDQEDLNAYLADILNKLQRASVYLQANVAPTYVLENILINL
ncbi:MAG: hypothetical protein NTX66_04645, partial [Candidatus Falkowbacteria bacterium]|nr:hypothetical protein [Candidatus Falkowbacteria bacterium]